MMRLMLVALLVLSGAWAVFWWYGSGGEKARIASVLETIDGITHTEQTMRGFPNRYDTTLEDVAVNAGVWAWQMPWVQLFRLSYRQGHYVVSLPTEQTMTLGQTQLSLLSEDARASVVFQSDGFDHSDAVVDALSVTSDAGWSVQMQTLLFATRQVADGLEIGVRITGLQAGEKITDLGLNGVLTFAGGVPSGALEVIPSDPADFAAILETMDVPSGAPGDTLDFVSGAITYGGINLGDAPQFPTE